MVAVKATDNYNVFQAIVDKNPAVASAALVSSLHLLRKNPEVIRRWANEVQEAVSSDRLIGFCIPLRRLHSKLYLR